MISSGGFSVGIIVKKFLINIAIALLIIILDQVTKYYIQHFMYHGESISVIEGLFNITFVQNTGVAFGMGATASSGFKKIFFLLIPVFACLILVYLLWRSRNNSKLYLLKAAYILILAGAIGNLIDRFSKGYVIDFLDFYWKNWHFPAFNVADSSISVAAGLLILDFIVQSFSTKSSKNPSI